MAPTPGNFRSFHGAGTVADSGLVTDGSAGAAASYALALLQVLYAYSGWENANYVLTEVRNAPRTLKIAAPLAVSTITALYVLANIAYVSAYPSVERRWLVWAEHTSANAGPTELVQFAAMSKSEISDAGVVVGARFFQNVWGESRFVTQAMPVFIALSALGNVFAQSFAMPRVKQELSKEGILPFSRFWASDWPFNAPSGSLLLHWLFTVALILGSVTPDTYTFVTNIFIYTGNWVKLFLGIGLLYLTFARHEGWREQRTTFHSYPILTMFWLCSLVYVLAAPFIRNSQLASIPWWVVPTLGTSMLVIGTVYWLVWAKVMPLLGFHIQHEVQILPDGSERVRYIVSRHLPATVVQPWRPTCANTRCSMLRRRRPAKAVPTLMVKLLKRRFYALGR